MTLFIEENKNICWEPARSQEAVWSQVGCLTVGGGEAERLPGFPSVMGEFCVSKKLNWVALPVPSIPKSLGVHV